MKSIVKKNKQVSSEKKEEIRNDEEKYSLRELFLLFIITSIIGYVWEVIYYYIRHKGFVNCGTLYGPWLPIYGAGGILVLLALKPLKKKPILFFLSTFFLAGIIEYSIAWYLETFQHMRWWNYSRRFLNLHGRIYLDGLLLFTVAGMVFAYYGAPFMKRLLNKINDKVLKVVCIILLVLFSIDFVYSVIHPNRDKGVPIETTEKK